MKPVKYTSMTKASGIMIDGRFHEIGGVAIGDYSKADGGEFVIKVTGFR